MRIVIFGLTISSSWGNGHATIWRGLCRALHARGHEIVFFERDVPYYARYRDDVHPRGCDLRLYGEWEEIAGEARRQVCESDVAMVTSYCPDGRAAARAVLEAGPALKVFYDLDTPVTLARLRDGHAIPYLPEDGLGAFDFVLSYTGGRALDELRTTLGARAVAPLYGSVDADVHRPASPEPAFASALSYLGTFSPDRQDALDRLFLETARRRPECRFALAGSQYPPEFGWTQNIFYLSHLTPAQHPAFYCSSGLTLNVTRAPMAAMGYCPSGRLFEAAASGAAILTDWWEGLDTFFEPGRDLLTAATTEEAMAAVDLPQTERRALGLRARERTLDCHTAAQRARDFELIVESLGADATGTSRQPAFSSLPE
jgi:spore maturation protein CgeB